jgi:hypothetical protein
MKSANLRKLNRQVSILIAICLSLSTSLAQLWLVNIKNFAANVKAQQISDIRIINAGIKETKLFDKEGVALNESSVVVPFTDRIKIINAAKISLHGQAFDPETGSFLNIKIPITFAGVDEQNPNTLILITGQLTPKNSILRIGGGALAGLNGDFVVKQKATLWQGEPSEDFTLANRPFKPEKINLFLNLAFFDASANFDNHSPALTEEEAIMALEKFLDARIAVGQLDESMKAAAVALFNSDNVKNIIPNPSLRAALALLKGSVAEGAINAILIGNNQSGKPYSEVIFDQQVTSGNAKISIASDGEIAIRINEILQNEPLPALSALLAELTLYQDSSFGQQEDIIAMAIRTFVWSQYLLALPQIANRNSLLVRILNTDLLAMLNSGHYAFPAIGLMDAPRPVKGIVAPSSQVFVGGSPGITSFEDYQRKYAQFLFYPDIDSPGNPYLDSALSAIARKKMENSGFNRATIRLLDEKQKVIENNQTILLAHAINLSL